MNSAFDFLIFTRIADRLVPFITQNYPKWGNTKPMDLYEYLAWYWDRRLLACSSSGDEIYAVCTIKLFDRIEDFLTPWIHRPGGKFCMIDLMVASSPLGMADCFETLFKRWGPQEIIMWERGERTEKSEKAPRMYTWLQFKKLARRLTYGSVE